MARTGSGHRRRALRRACGLAASLAIMLDLVLAPFSASAQDEATKIALDKPIALIDADGRTVTTSDFPGKWLLVYFGYTHCADQCPTALSTMAEALDELGPAAAHLQPLFITVDPEPDRGPALRKFTDAFDKRLIGLTGTPEQIAAAAKALGVTYEKVLLGNDDYVVDHSATMSLIDPTGHTAETFKIGEAYLITAKLVETLDRAGVPLDRMNNLGAYR